MIDAAAQVLAVVTEQIERTVERTLQLGKVSRTAIGESLFGELPDAFVGVQLGSVTRKPDQMKAPDAPAQLGDQAPAVRPSSVPQNEDVATEVTEQVPQEAARLQLLDVLEVELEVQVEALTRGAHADAGDGGDPIAPVVMPQYRCLAHRCPGLGDRGGQEEARLVDKDEVGTQPTGVFFTRGQSSRKKRRIFRSSRSSARFCGFW